MTILAKPILRLYRMEDETMETRAQTMHDNLSADLALFTAKFPWLDAAFVTAFLTAITTAKNYPDDGEVVAMLQVKTSDVNAAVAVGMRALDELDTYAKLAYPADLKRQRMFGQDTWGQARSDQERMIHALHRAHNLANTAEYKTALTGKGMTTAAIDALLTIATDIDSKNEQQELAKSQRPVTTEDRVNVHNNVWSTQKTIAICALLVFRDDAAKREQYHLYPGTNDNTTVIVHVQNPADHTPRVGADVLLTNTALAGQITDVSGDVKFDSVNMPDFVNVKATYGGNSAVLNSQPVLQGDSVTITIEV